jgi:2-dehydro-3-deoxygalactonokinase
MPRRNGRRVTEAQFIAVDWGTSRFRAYLVDGAGSVLDRVGSQEGMSAVAPGAFPEVLARHIGAWPRLPVIMAGMVGSRNGWREVPYAACPAGAAEIAGGALRLEPVDGRPVSILPGLSCRNDGIFDVMRGEETLILGSGLADGAVILPGTHSKWARVKSGRIVSFRTFMTGEFYALLSQHSILRLLGREPPDHGGFAKGLAAARRPGGLTHQAFSARAAVLAGDLEPEEVLAYLSGLLIGAEVAGATQEPRAAVLVAEGALAENYAEALAAAGMTARVIAPEAAFIAGIAVARAAGV